MDSGNLSGSFRDPSGFLFRRNGVTLRQINLSYKEDYDLLMSRGLYKKLTDDNLLIPHEEESIALCDKAYKVIKPKQIPFVSYPYEWCFSQLKHAALATLKIQKAALEFGMSLKDASAYNIQFLDGRPVLIDTLSFEKYVDGRPWVAYRQFCQHFLAPLALMSYRDIRLSQLLRVYIDGIPLDLADRLMPLFAKFHPAVLTHVHFHCRSQDYFSDKQVPVRHKQDKISKFNLLAIIDSLDSAINGLCWRPQASTWAGYYQDNNYSQAGFEHKKQVVKDFLNKINPKNVWDLGANTGVFSRIASGMGMHTVSFDADPSAVEKNYLETVQKSEKNILPLLMDLTNPSPAIGWENHERQSLFERGPTDTVLALALVHHLAISNNLPLGKIAQFMHGLCQNLIIEFIPKEDSQVKRLLASREDIFTEYAQDQFEEEFRKYFTINACVIIKDSLRVLYLMQKK